VTTAERLDIGSEAAAITAALKTRVDLSYEWGMRRTVPSQQPAHSVRLPEIRRVASEWWRGHKGTRPEALLALAEALWDTGWREERIVAMEILDRAKLWQGALPWSVIDRWSAGIDNWELVDNMASHLTGPMLVTRPRIESDLRALLTEDLVWRRRLAIVTLIFAARADERWVPALRDATQALKGDRGPTMRKALDWARRTAEKLENPVG
jgi:3-methyladenine DNA glycosylase AlkD